MGRLWDRFTGNDATDRSAEVLRGKFPHERGLSAETMDAVDAGEIMIVPDDPQSELLKDIHEEQ